VSEIADESEFFCPIHGHSDFNWNGGCDQCLFESLQRDNARLREALELAENVPITTPELIRLRNAGQITFDKQVFYIIDCLLQQRAALHHTNSGELAPQGVKP
jgi:hypothetical protein